MGLSLAGVLDPAARAGGPLEPEEAEAVLGRVLAGEATPAQVGAFLALLHAKGETAEEVTGLARAMVAAAVPSRWTRPPGPRWSTSSARAATGSPAST